jgi:CBS domain-containing protein
MAEHGVTRVDVVDRADPGVVLGAITLEQLLEGRLRDLREERHSERVLTLGDLVGFGRRNGDEPAPVSRQ